jgi:integrase
MAKILTDAAVEKFKSGATRREIADAKATGLYLVVQPSGAKSWALRFRRPDGRPAKLTLGPVDFSRKEPDGEPVLGTPLSLAAARALAAEQHRQRKRGIDVASRHVAEKRRARQAAADAAANTFPVLATRFINEHAKPETRRWRDTARLLGLDYPPHGEPSEIKGGLAARWHDRELRTITGDDLHDLVDEARRSGIPGLGRRRKGMSDTQGRAMAAALSKLFAWAKDHRHVRINPAVDLYKPDAPKARERVLNVKTDVRLADELRWFWCASDMLREPFGPLLKLLLLTGCRLNELAKLHTDEINDDWTTLRLPGQRTKNHRPHDVHLPPLARDLLASVKRIKGAKFAFTTTGNSPVSGWTKTKRRLDTAMLELAREERGKDAKIDPWRLHDLRRTCATGMAGIGVAPHVIEACLNHVSGAKASVAGTYNRERYEPEKRVAWERWAEHVKSVVTGDASNVIPFRAGA